MLPTLSKGQALLISFQLENSQACQLKLLDLLGQVQQSSAIRLGKEGMIEWPIKRLPRATYLLQILGENGALLAVKRLVILGQ